MKKIIFLMIFSSCVMDFREHLAFVKNQSDRNIVLISFGDDSNIKDSTLFYNGESFSIKRNSSSEIFQDFVTDPKENKVFFTVYDEDTVFKFIKSGLISGIASQSFIKKFSISLDSITKNDTITYR